MVDHPLVMDGGRAVLEGLLNGSLWSIVLVVVMVPIVRALAPSSPAIRHLAWLGALVMIVVFHIAATIDSLGRGDASVVAPATPAATGNAELPSPASVEVPAEPGPARLLLEMPEGAWLPLLLSVIVLVAIVRLILMTRGLLYWRSIRSRSEPAHAQLMEGLTAIPPGRGRRLPDVRISREVVCPVTMGYLHPTILLPTALPGELTPLELRQVLVHELAHVRRYDDWANLAQRLVETVLFFNPAVTWIGRRMEMERELACDQHVLARVGGPKVYASCLLRLATLARFPASGLVSGAAASRLTERVEAMLRAPRSTPARRNALALGWSVPALLLAVAAGRGALPIGVAIAAPEWLATRPVRVDVAARVDRDGSDLLAAASREENHQQGTAGFRQGIAVTMDEAAPGDPVTTRAPVHAGAAPGDGAPEVREVALDLVPMVTPSTCGSAGAAGCGSSPSTVASTVADHMTRTVAARSVVAPPTTRNTAGERRRRGVTVLARGSGRAPLIGTPGDVYEQPRKSGITTSGTSIGMMPEGPVVRISDRDGNPEPWGAI